MLTEAQRAIRRTGVTATDIGALMGLNPWKTPLGVYYEKNGEELEQPNSENLERGEFLQPALTFWYEKRTGLVVSPERTVVNARNPLIIATPDGFLRERSGGENIGTLEVKAPGEFATEWGTPGTDEVPGMYLVQGAWQMAATDLPRCDYCARIGRACGGRLRRRDRYAQGWHLGHGIVRRRR